MSRRRGFGGVACLTLALSLSAALAQAPSSYDQGRQAFAEQRYADAARLLAAAVASGSAPPDARLLEAKALVNTGDLAASEHALRLYLAQTPRSAAALYLLAYLLQRGNHPRESLQNLTAAAAIETPRADDLKIAALDYVLLEDYVDAITWLQRAVSLQPDNGEAWYDLGRSLMHEGRYVDAETAFHHCLSLHADDARALNNLGLSLEAQNRPAEALASYEQAIHAQAGQPHRSEQPLLNYGALLNGEGKGAQALTALQQAVALAPGQSRCHEELARALLQLHQEPAAIAELKAALALDDRNPRLHYQLGQVYRHTGRLAEAEVELKRSAALYGNASSTPAPL